MKTKLFKVSFYYLVNQTVICYKDVWTSFSNQEEILEYIYSNYDAVNNVEIGEVL